jgi:hypothetical protein
VPRIRILFFITDTFSSHQRKPGVVRVSQYLSHSNINHHLLLLLLIPYFTKHLCLKVHVSTLCCGVRRTLHFKQTVMVSLWPRNTKRNMTVFRTSTFVCLGAVRTAAFCLGDVAKTLHFTRAGMSCFSVDAEMKYYYIFVVRDIKVVI